MDTGEISHKPTDMHSVSPVWRIVAIYYLVCSRLLHCKRIFPNSKEKNIVYLQMFVDQYLLNDMRQILINNIKMHMNVSCAEMTSSEIANLTMLVEVRNAKTFYKKICKQWSSEFFFFQIYKGFLRTECVRNEILAMQVVNIFLKKYSC